MNKKLILILSIIFLVSFGTLILLAKLGSPELTQQDLKIIDTLNSESIVLDTLAETEESLDLDAIEFTEIIMETDTETSLETAQELEEIVPIEEYYIPADYVEPIIEDPNFPLTLEDILSEEYNPDNLYGLSEYDCYLAAKILELEGGEDYIVLEHKMILVSVMMNRLISDRFDYAHCIEDVIHAEGQYYPKGDPLFDSTIPRDSNLKIVYWITNHGVICPENVCYQANFSQGSGNYRIFYVPILDNYTYFCYV